jgi:hypothetical protein
MLSINCASFPTLGELLKTHLLFNEEQWDLMRDLVIILAPCEQITRELSSKTYPSISRVILILSTVVKIIGHLNLM